jgi:L-seryl-tRNA(Ser) seleniumtransferase
VFLKVHRSNFTLAGYTREASIAELAQVARPCGAHVVYDLGAGCLEPFAGEGLAAEPDVQSALAAGADLVTMSGDKLLGGPQAGILAGRATIVDALRRNPLARALRIDKLTLAALQATLLSSVTSEGAGIPTLRFILTKPEHIADRARRLVARLGQRVAADLEVAPGRASVGGGSFAAVELPSYEVRVRARGMRGTELHARLRRGTPAVVARIKGDIVALDLRCIEDDAVETLAAAVERALGGEST